MAEEKPSPPPVPPNQDKTTGNPPASPSNRPTTHGAGRPTPPPNQGETRGDRE